MSCSPVRVPSAAACWCSAATPASASRRCWTTPTGRRAGYLERGCCAPSAETSLTAAICLNGYYGEYYEARALPSSPFDYVRPDAPPFFIAHGDLDTEVPVEQARAFAESLRRVSTSDVVYVELRGGQHAFDLFHSPRFEAVIDGIDAFVTSVRSSRPRPPVRG